MLRCDEMLRECLPLIRVAYSGVRRRVFDLVHDRHSSTSAMCLYNFYTALIITSSVVTCLETMSSWNHPERPDDAQWWFRVDLAMAVLFSVQFTLLLWSSDEAFCDLLTCPNLLIDALAVVPFWMHLCLAQHVDVHFVRLSRAFRLLRLFTVVGSSAVVRLALRVLRLSVSSLMILVVFLSFGVFYFGAVMWSAERRTWRGECFAHDEECAQFQSVLDCMYWAITTLTSVGYGELCPRSTLGKCIAVCCMVVGTVCIALPQSVLCHVFEECYAAESQAAATCSILGPASGNKTIIEAQSLLHETREKLQQLAFDVQDLCKFCDAEQMLPFLDVIEGTLRSDFWYLEMVLEHVADDLREDAGLERRTTAPPQVSGHSFDLSVRHRRHRRHRHAAHL
uniref:Ion transport domain-containing protein n=1 Tax=Noctiluca scintillans TaxID=2966 RepID=A0A7S0ZRD5_NOCSC|mmetsp:Transcript_15745/g.42932  ORF Transcript_15745/g.42932 Transcript_15745/m.42932 type:complete len:395 (+) Transcript_15745:144-1328(+)